MNNTHPIRAFKDNYIWMLTDASNQAFVVDPGDATPVIDTFIKQHKSLAGILITHHHADHTGGIAKLIDWAGNIPVYGSAKSPNALITHPLKQGDTISCLNLTFQVQEIPGHTLDHLAYSNETSLFSGDTLFSAGCGRVFEGTPAEMFHSLNKLKQLADETKIYCGHEYTLANLRFAEHVMPENVFIKEKILILQKVNCTLPSTMGDEKKMNPFLRCEEFSVKESVENYCKKILKNSVEVFTELREWKNSFVY